MFLLYSFLLTLGFLLMSPLFLLRRKKYASGFRQRLGNYPEFSHHGRKVIWLHCVSVGETNAARPLVDQLLEAFPDHRLIISTTTKPGQELAQKIFREKTDAVIYFPFDWKFSVHRALAHYKPSLILLMETEIWPRFIREAKLSGANVAIVNGRLSERSFQRYSKVRPFIKTVLADVDLALMQGERDADHLISLGLPASKAQITGNLKFDLAPSEARESEFTAQFKARFGVSSDRPLIVAASTHEPEERWLLNAYCSLAAGSKARKPRLLIAPRHPERFGVVAKLLSDFRNSHDCKWNQYKFVRRSSDESDADRSADIILLDSIGEVRAVFPLAEIVFVGGSLIPHGGQSFLEPAAAGRAIITGPYTYNFEEAIRQFRENKAIIQMQENRPEHIVDDLLLEFSDLLDEPEELRRLGQNAATVMKANRGATVKTVEFLRALSEQTGRWFLK